MCKSLLTNKVVSQGDQASAIHLQAAVVNATQTTHIRSTGMAFLVSPDTIAVFMTSWHSKEKESAEDLVRMAGDRLIGRRDQSGSQRVSFQLLGLSQGQALRRSPKKRFAAAVWISRSRDFCWIDRHQLKDGYCCPLARHPYEPAVLCLCSSNKKLRLTMR